MQEWKPIHGYNGAYIVSNTGNIYSNKSKIMMKTWMGKNGYMTVKLCKHGMHKMMSVHRLVADAFLPNPHNYPVVNHKDHNPENNCVENLEWCTQQYNVNYGDAPKRRLATRRKTGQIEKDVKRMIEAHQKRVRCLETKKEYVSLTDAEADTGAWVPNIVKVLRGKRHTAGGFHWELA